VELTSKGDIKTAQSVFFWMESTSNPFITAKLYTVMIKGKKLTI